MTPDDARTHIPCTEIAVLRAQHDDCHDATNKRLDGLHVKVTTMGERMDKRLSAVETAQILQKQGMDFKTKMFVSVIMVLGSMAAVVVGHFLK